jgi:hypothetical protein
MVRTHVMATPVKFCRISWTVPTASKIDVAHRPGFERDRLGNNIDTSIFDQGESSAMRTIAQNAIEAGALPRDQQSGLYMVLTAAEVKSSDLKQSCGWHNAHVGSHAANNPTFRWGLGQASLLLRTWCR